MQKTVAAAIFTHSNPQLKIQHSWQQPSRALSCVPNPTGPSVAAQVSLQPDTAAKPALHELQKFTYTSPVCSYNEWDLLEVMTVACVYPGRAVCAHARDWLSMAVYVCVCAVGKKKMSCLSELDTLTAQWHIQLWAQGAC